LTEQDRTSRAEKNTAKPIEDRTKREEKTEINNLNECKQIQNRAGKSIKSRPYIMTAERCKDRQRRKKQSRVEEKIAKQSREKAQGKAEQKTKSRAEHSTEHLKRA
jgi:hypothetical protein